MKPILTLFYGLLFSVALFAQPEFQIPKCPELKAGKPGLPAEFEVEKVKWGAMVNKCWKGPREYGAWFNFEATSPKALLTLKYGGENGTVKGPMIYLGQTKVTGRGELLMDLACADNPQNGTLSLAYNGLKPGERYWAFVTIDNNPDHQGTFSLDLDASFDNDFAAGATTVPHENWCSEKGEHTLAGSSVDGPALSCNSPAQANRWFNFTAKGPYVTISAAPASGQPFVLALFDKNQKEVACASSDASENNPVSLEYDKLVPGSGYYFSVNKKTADQADAPFTVCISDSRDETNHIIGRVRSKADGPVASSKVSLLDENMNFITSVVTDKEGVFKFEKLPVEPTYLTLLEEKDPDLIVEIYLKNSSGEIIARGTRMGDGIYGFSKMPFLEEIKLLGLDDLRMKVKPEMVGITGKLVDDETRLFGQSNITVSLCDENKKQITTTQTDMGGRFWFADIQNGEYTIRFLDKPASSYAEIAMVNDQSVPVRISTSADMDGDGYFTFRKLPFETIELLTLQVEDTELKVPTDLSGLESGNSIVLNNLYFKTASYELLPESHMELDAVVNTLLAKPGLVLEISGHTDNTGNEKQNLLLSQNRAGTVLDYLVQKGIPKDRLLAKGLGSSVPLADNTSEQGRMKNRRVEIKVVR